MKTAFAVLVLALFLTPNSLKAEQSGWFVGIQGGYAKAQTERIFDGETITTSQTNIWRNYTRDDLNTRNWGCAGATLGTPCLWSRGSTTTSTGKSSSYYPSEDYTGYNAGLLAGYKHFFSPKFGLRLYTLFDASFFKNDESALQHKFQAYNYTLIWICFTISLLKMILALVSLVEWGLAALIIEAVEMALMI